MNKGRLVAVLALAGAMALGAVPVRAADDKAEPIDWNYARTLLEESRSGQGLTDQEKNYLQRAQQARAPMQAQQTTRTGTTRAATQADGTASFVVPLDQMTAQDRYKGQDGGLYGGGRNDPPEAHQQAARKELAGIVPRDAGGKTAPDGKIVLLSIGMSNTTQEFSRFKEIADPDKAKSPRVVIVDGAQGGQDAAAWVGPAKSRVWATADERLAAAGVTAQQVQAIWLKQAMIQPARLGAFPAHAEELKGRMASILNLARQRFPNLRVAYLSSRIYAGYAKTMLNPEPYAYESALAVRGLIQDQIKGDKALNYDPSRGEIRSPLLLWGPYLWANGTRPRKSDGLVWKREDLGPDGTHPSGVSGRQKVAGLLLDFFKTSPYAKGWFCAPAGAKGS